MAVAGGAVYLLIGLRALAGMYAVGDVVQYVGAATALVMAVTVLSGELGSVYNNAVYIKPLLDYLDLSDVLVKGSKSLPEKEEYLSRYTNLCAEKPEYEAGGKQESGSGGSERQREDNND